VYLEKKILLVEDEQAFSILVKQELEREGFMVDTAYDGIDAEHLFKDNIYNLIILDVNIPFKDGIALCRDFKLKNENVSILMLTIKSNIENKVEAFNVGADDYLVKPFHFEELIARTKTLLKRNEKLVVEEDPILHIDNITINHNKKLVAIDNTPIPLTAKEYALFVLLVKNKGKVISKQEILEKVWNLTFDTGTNTIEVYISFLRNKLEKPFNNKIIFTKPGFGYFIK
jgi:two-component system, OmpR family, copper resistance phosphate regulon response regulator CusR